MPISEEARDFNLREKKLPYLFGAEDNRVKEISEKEANDFYNNLESVLDERKHHIESCADKSEIYNVIFGIIKTFNLILRLIPGASKKTGIMMSWLKDIAEGFGGGDSFDIFNDYSIQFGFPSGFSITFHFNANKRGGNLTRQLTCNK